MKLMRILTAILLLFSSLPVYAADENPVYQIENGKVVFACDYYMTQIKLCSLEPDPQAEVDYNVPRSSEGYDLSFVPKEGGRYVVLYMKTKYVDVSQVESLYDVDVAFDLYGVENIGGSISVTKLDSMQYVYDSRAHYTWYTDETADEIRITVGTYIYDWLQAPSYYYAFDHMCYLYPSIGKEDPGYWISVHSLNVVSNEPLVVVQNNGLKIPNEYTAYNTAFPNYASTEAMQQGASPVYYTTAIYPVTDAANALSNIFQPRPGSVTVIDDDAEHPRVFRADIEHQDMNLNSLVIYEGARCCDLNGDTMFNVDDVRMLQEYLLNKQFDIAEQNQCYWQFADFNRDGTINAVDQTLMKQSLMQLEQEQMG